MYPCTSSSARTLPLPSPVSATEFTDRKTEKFFEKKFDLNIQSSKDVGGIGSFSLRNVVQKEVIYVGEAAGLQDFLFGFGMRSAITSGYLAAHCIIKNENYGEIIKKHFMNKRKAGVVNRYLWEEMLSKKDYSFMIRISEFAKNSLFLMYNYNLLQRMIYPFALRHLQKRYPILARAR